MKLTWQQCAGDFRVSAAAEHSQHCQTFVHSTQHWILRDLAAWRLHHSKINTSQHKQIRERLCYRRQLHSHNYSPLQAVHIQFIRQTSNVTGRHWGPKQRLRAGYRAPSLKQMSHVAMRFHRQSSSVVLRAFPVLWVYSTIGHHPHP